MKSRVILFILFLTSVVGLSLTMTQASPVAAAPTTYTVTSTNCTGPGSIIEAIAMACDRLAGRPEPITHISVLGKHDRH